jgi:hypothetical protein
VGAQTSRIGLRDVEGQTEMIIAPRLGDPDLELDSAICRHESAHAVSNFILGIDSVSATAGDLEGVVQHVRTDDVYARCVSLLAGDAYERSIGQHHAGDNFAEDEVLRILRARGLSGSRVDEAYAIAENAANGLVREPRFRHLVNRLLPVLRRERSLSAATIHDVLCRADTEFRTREGRP